MGFVVMWQRMLRREVHGTPPNRFCLDGRHRLGRHRPARLIRSAAETAPLLAAPVQSRRSRTKLRGGNRCGYRSGARAEDHRDANRCSSR